MIPAYNHTWKENQINTEGRADNLWWVQFNREQQRQRYGTTAWVPPMTGASING